MSLGINRSREAKIFSISSILSDKANQDLSLSYEFNEIRLTSPGLIRRSNSRTRGISGNKSSSRLEGAASATTANWLRSRFCWYERFRSAVIKTSSDPTANCNSSPLFVPAHPISGKVATSYSLRLCFRRRGRHSSSSNFMQELFLCEFKYLNGMFS